MPERKDIHKKAQAFFENLWQRGDPWDLETCEFEQTKYSRQIALLQGRRIGRVLEIGCGAGCFTRLLAPLADQVVALDISPTAIARARALGVGSGMVDYRVANIMNYDLRTEELWDLIVMSETIYYLGWLYPFFDVAWLAHELFESTRPGGLLLMANTIGCVEDYLLRPWIIRTYQDLFLNVGYIIESEEMFTGIKEGVTIETLISSLAKLRKTEILLP